MVLDTVFSCWHSTYGVAFSYGRETTRVVSRLIRFIHSTIFFEDVKINWKLKIIHARDFFHFEIHD